MKIIVPATSANIGPGFDSVGVAVTKYLQIEVCEERDEWLIEHQIGKWIPMTSVISCSRLPCKLHQTCNRDSFEND